MKTRLFAAVVLISLAIQIPAAAEDAVSGLVAYVPMVCERQPGCRIDCFQDGRIVASKLEITPQDTIRLAVNTRGSNGLAPLWIEIRSAHDSGSETMLLGRQTTCHLHELSIRPTPRR